MSEKDPSLWRRARDVFDRAVELPVDARGRFLGRHCAGEPGLREAVERLLSADESGGAGLGDSAVVEALEDALDKSLGRAVGPYHLLCKIGSGGMGTVYLAEHGAPDRRAERSRVAIKLLRHGVAHRETLRRFRLESQVLASLEHPHITRLLDDGVTGDGRPYLVMEWIDGRPITTYCDDERLSIDERLALVAKIADALQHAHRHLIVHRDIKPSNVLVTADGVPMVLDFGIAKVLEGSPLGGSSTQTLSRPLTPGYASPEQVEGANVGTASDVYSLAVLAYELVIGQTPFDWTGLSLPEIQALYRDEAAPPLASTLHRLEDEVLEPLAAARRMGVEQMRRASNGDLGRVLAKALEHDAGERYPSARHFADDLRRVVEGRPVQARPATAMYRFRKLVERNRAAAALVALATAAILTLAVSLAIQSWRVARERDLARAEQRRAEAQRSQATEAADFLLDLFGRSSTGPPLTSDEMLEIGARRLYELDDPAGRATLMTAIARARENLGDFDAAAALFEQALALRREAYQEGLGVTAGDVAASLDAYGKILRLQGRFEDAERHSREALAMRRGLFGNDHEAVAQSLDNLAEALHELGRYDEAEPLYQDALEIRHRLFGDSHLLVAESLEHYALLIRNRGDHDKARELYAEVLKSRQAHLPRRHADLARSHYQLGNSEHDLKHYEEAETQFRQALEIFRQVYREEHPAIASCLHDLGVLSFDRGDTGEAAALLQEALAMRRRIYTDNHSELVQTLGMLAAVALERGELDEAGKRIGEALERGRKLYGEEHPYTAITWRYAARLEASRGHLQAAAATMERVVDVQEATLGPDHPKMVQSYELLAEYLDQLGRFDEAREPRRKAYENLRGRLGDEHPDTSAARARLGERL